MSTQNREVQLEGGVTFWSLTESFDRTMLLSHWRRAGMAGLVPPPTTPLEALKASVRAAAAGHNLLARKRAGSCMAIVREIVIGKQADYEDELIVSILKDGTLEFSNWSHPAVTAIHRGFHMRQTRVDGKKVGAALATVASYMKATTLRPRGGVYWLPSEAMPRWRHIAAGVGASAIAGRARIYVITTAMSKGTVTAVIDSVKRNVSNKLVALHKELAAPKLGNRGRQTKLKEIEKLSQTARYYSELFGTSLSDLEEACEASSGDEVESILSNMDW